MNDMMQKVRVAAHAEGALFRIKLGQVMKAIALLALSMVFALFAIGALNAAAFKALDRSFGAVVAGSIVGGVDLLIALVLMVSALGEKPQTDEQKLAEEVKDMTYRSLGEDVETVRDELRGFLQDVRGVRTAIAFVTSAIGGPLNLIVELVNGLSGLTKSESRSSGQSSNASDKSS